MNNDANNRRRFFRIVDEVGVSYRVLSEAERDAQQDQSEGTSHYVDKLSVMHKYNEEMNVVLERLQTSNPDAATAIDCLNKKLDAFLMMLELDNLITQRACHRVEEASISASGIAFPVGEQVAQASILVLDLLLRPSSNHVNAMGRVISCDALSDADSELGYYLRVEFMDMNEKDREILIQHIVQRQGALLRALRDQMDQEESNL